jgi:hypothetical protein
MVQMPSLANFARNPAGSAADSRPNLGRQWRLEVLCRPSRRRPVPHGDDRGAAPSRRCGRALVGVPDLGHDVGQLGAVGQEEGDEGVAQGVRRHAAEGRQPGVLAALAGVVDAAGEDAVADVVLVARFAGPCREHQLGWVDRPESRSLVEEDLVEQRSHVHLADTGGRLASGMSMRACAKSSWLHMSLPSSGMRAVARRHRPSPPEGPGCRARLAQALALGNPLWRSMYRLPPWHARPCRCGRR